MSRVHLLAGRNNVGKSNALTVASRVIADIKARNNGTAWSPQSGDQPRDWDTSRRRQVSFCWALTPAVREAFGLPAEGEPEHDSVLMRLFRSAAYATSDGQGFWIEYDTGHWDDVQQVAMTPSERQFTAGNQDIPDIYDAMAQLSSSRTNQTSSSLFQNFQNVLSRVSWMQLLPQTFLLQAFREVGPLALIRNGESTESGLATGRGFLSTLAAYENPNGARARYDRPVFEAVQQFVRDVLDDPNAIISVDATEVDLVVRTGHDWGSWKDLGSGIAEVILIAGVATINRGALICIEEPELHLHPTLQRKIIQFLAARGSNRYLISTHSAQMLDADVASISHLTKSADGWTSVAPVVAAREHSGLVFDLGNRASDLVQSNFVVWVEGPSDRIYINHWLSLAAPQIEEGIHYSVLFYGGSMLSHLTPEDPDVRDLISLARINRNFAIVIDSDRVREGAKLSATKQRVLAELKKIGGLEWVTDGYTVENYVPDDALIRAIEVAHPKQTYTMTPGQWASPLGRTLDGTSIHPDKVKVARAVCSSSIPLDDWKFDLRARVVAIVQAITNANA